MKLKEMIGHSFEIGPNSGWTGVTRCSYGLKVGMLLQLSGWKLILPGSALRILLQPTIMGGGQRKFSIATNSINADYERNTARCQDGTVKSVIKRVYAIEEIGRAFERLRSGRIRGKLVVVISEGEK
jgi:NADPH:quinone reductase-like Zn-dependent oxidoreductase